MDFRDGTRLIRFRFQLIYAFSCVWILQLLVRQIFSRRLVDLYFVVE